jgi:hypothetical protein
MHISYTDLHFSALPSLPPLLAHILDDGLQLPRVPQRVLDNLIARDQNVLAHVVVLLLREVYPAVLNDPT